MASTHVPRPIRRRFGSLVWAFVLLWALPRMDAAAALAPTNDTCAGAFNIPGAGPFPFYSPVMDISSATSTGESAALLDALCSSPVSRGIWFKFRPLSNAFFTVTTLAPATTVNDTVLAIYTSTGGCGNSFAIVACNDDISEGVEFKSSVTPELLADTDYYIVAWKYNIAPPSPGQTNLQMVSQPSKIVP